MTEVQKIESIGERLHKARLRKKATIDQVYKETKIHPKIVTALEEDRYEEFLNPTYTKAFLKTYCRYLELDANKILEDYKAICKEEEPPKSQLELEPKTDEKQDLFSKVNWQKYIAAAKKWVIPIGAGIAGLFLSIFLIILVSKAVIKIKNIKISKPKITIVAKKQEPSIIKPLSLPRNQPLSLIVKTKGDAWLRVNADGKNMFEGILKKGSVESYKADEKFQLWTGKAEFLELIVNGEFLGSPGKGVLRKIILTREGLSIEKK